MTVTKNRVVWGLLATVLLVPLSGCMIAADLINPDFWGQIGIDSALISQPEGTIIVVFNNQTSTTAYFQAFVLPDATDVTRNSRNLAAQVNGGDLRNEVIDCPIELIAPGSLASDYSINTVGATLTVVDDQQTATTVQVEYDTALALQEGVAFQCGDVIEIRLSQTGAAEAEDQFLLTMSVIPGQ